MSRVSSCTALVLLLLSPMAMAEDKKHEPTLVLLKWQSGPGSAYLIPVVVMTKRSPDEKPRSVAFQFAKTRRSGTLPSPQEAAWYRLYDYDEQLGRRPEQLGVLSFEQQEPQALPARSEITGDSPTLPSSHYVPYPKKGEPYLVYRHQGNFYLETDLDGGRVAFRFADYAAIHDLFEQAQAPSAFKDDPPNPSTTIYDIPGDVRPRDENGKELRAVCYPDNRTSLEAVVTLGEAAAAEPNAVDEDRRLHFDLRERPGDLSQERSRLLGLPLRYAFFSAEEEVTELVLAPGAFRRLASIALAPDPKGGPYERPGDAPGEPAHLLLSFGAEFDLNVHNERVPRRRVLRAVNLEQKAIFASLGAIGTGTAKEDLILGPVDWPAGAGFTAHRQSRRFRDVEIDGRSLRLRDRIVHEPSEASFLLIEEPGDQGWFYIQEKEVSIRQWQRFLDSKSGKAYLEELKAESHEGTSDADLTPRPQAGDLERFLLLLATRMKDRAPGGQANRSSALTPMEWADAMSQDAPMGYLSPHAARQYIEWLAAGGQVSARLPTLEQWRRAARPEDLRTRYEAGSRVKDLAWVGYREAPHSLADEPTAAWRSHETLLSLIGNLEELVQGAEPDTGEQDPGAWTVGSSYRTEADIDTVLDSKHELAEHQAAVTAGLRPVLTYP